MMSKTGHSRFLIRITLLPVLFLLMAFGCGLRSGAGANPVNSTDNVKVKKDIAYYSGDRFDKDRHILDLYLPKGTKNFPVLMFVHGGGYFSGDKADTANLCMTLAKNGIGVASINYRLHPEAGNPGIIYDVVRAFNWTKKHIDDYGGDPKSVFVGGHSAGGHLATIIATNDMYLKKANRSSKEIKGAIGLSGVYVMSKVRTRSIFAQNQEMIQTCSPVYNVTSHTPPFLLFYAEHELEDLAQHAKKMKNAMDAKGRPVQLLQVPNKNHASIMKKVKSKNDLVAKQILFFISSNR